MQAGCRLNPEIPVYAHQNETPVVIHEKHSRMEIHLAEEQPSAPTETPIRTKPLPLEFPGLHYMDEREIEAVVRVLRSKSLFRFYGTDLQYETQKFEEEFAAFMGARYALAVASGTNALSVALSALAVGPGQEVIVPAYLWVSVVSAVVNQGAIPVLADIDETFGLDVQDVERKLSSQTSGIVMVHMSGAPGNVKPIAALARSKGLFLIEDCAQCCGGSIDGQKVGTFGDMGIYSFQPNKNMTCGEGGCVVTNDERLYRRAFASHDLGYLRDQNGRLKVRDAEVSLWGRGCRMDEVRAAILRVQLGKLPAITSAMRASKYRIRQSLEAFPEIGLRRIQDRRGDTGAFLITTYPDTATARQVNTMLRDEGIVASPGGISNVLMTEWGLHLYYNILSLVRKTSIDDQGFPWNLAENTGLAHRDYSRGACPIADMFFERSLLLAIPSCLTQQDEADIIQAFEKTLKTCSMRSRPTSTFIAVLSLAAALPNAPAQQVKVYVTSEAGDRITAHPPLHFSRAGAGSATFKIDDKIRYQEIVGFGASFLEAGMICLNSLQHEAQEQVLAALFDPETGAGFSAMKTVIAATDFMSAGPYYTYDDHPGDTAMKLFSIERDLGPNGLISYIKRARRYGHFVLQAPMDYPPDWMLFNVNSNQDVNPRYFDALARYYAHYAERIPARRHLRRFPESLQ